MEDIIFKEVKTNSDKQKVAILIYNGTGDPVQNLDQAVNLYVKNEDYSEFIDANMDNTRIRVIVKGINEMEKEPFNPVEHQL